METNTQDSRGLEQTVVNLRVIFTIAVGIMLFLSAAVYAQQAGSIRGVVYDKDFDAPMAFPEVSIVETGAEVTGTAEGNYVFKQVPPGTYTLVFSKQGYTRQVKSNVVVSPSQLTDVDVWLSGDFTEMEEFVVEDLQIGAGTEAGLLRLRMESPALIDSISSKLLSQSGFSDAASALNLVSGATVQDGKFAVIRGLPDRFVNSQINGVRLPTADEDKRAVQLDQFPSSVIESIQVTKTFTPDQQGDASGGAVNITLKEIPEQPIFQFKSQMSYNSQVSGRSDFLTYDGGGVNLLGNDDGKRDIPPLLNPDAGPMDPDFGVRDFGGAVGVSRGEAPVDYKWSIATGGKYEFDNGVRIGGFGSIFYERDSSFFENGIDDSLWVADPGEPLTPETIQGSPKQGDFKTALFDVTQGTELVQWGGLGTIGVETDNHAVGLTYLYTRTAEDIATLAEDTRGKDFFFPGYDPNDPAAEGNSPNNRDAAPYVRTETLEYTERTTETYILSGEHTLPGFEQIWWPVIVVADGTIFKPLPPELDWTLSNSTANLYQPDKRQFGSIWLAPSLNPGVPFLGIPPFVMPAVHRPFKPAANFTLGNLQRIYKEINEESQQYALNLTFPFEQWSGDEGYLKFGLFDDHVTRTFDQETFSNFNDNSAQFVGDFDEFWSDVFQSEDHLITAGPPFVDVDYNGDQSISAWYAMFDMPVSSWLNVIGGARFESTEISIVNIAEEDATWFPPGAISAVNLNPGDADVNFEQEAILPSIGFVLTPIDTVTLRGSYSETVARQTFKELTPVQQQEFLGGDIFIGNPELEMAALRNYDLRIDYTPYEGGLVSASWFYKSIEDTIENVQRTADFTFTTPVNFPEGELTGVELEMRQEMGQVWEGLEGLSLGANATFIDSEATLPEEEAAIFSQPGIMAPMTTRDMTNAPEHLYNLYVTYDAPVTGTQVSLFYTVKGDTLIAGAGGGESADGNFVPSVYATEFGTLNFTIAQKLGEHLELRFKARNITNPTIRTVYRSDFIDDDVTKTSFTKGIDYSIGLKAEFTF